MAKILLTLYLIIGTHGSSIYVYQFDQETGTFKYTSEIQALNPSYLAISANERFVYSVGENSGDRAVAYAFSFDKKEGMLHLLNQQQTDSPGPCYIATDRAGRFVVTANYSEGAVTVFPLSDEGLLQPVVNLFEFKGSGPVPNRQAGSHLHCVVFSPDGQALFATDLGGDRVYQFVTNDTAPFLATGEPFAHQMEPGSGPRHLTFHPNGAFAYLINELSGKVTVFKYKEGGLEPIQQIASDTSEGVGTKGSGDIHVSPDGRFLYASNRGNTNNIAIFSIDPLDGKVTLVAHQPTSLHPRNFVITPNGKYLLVANRNSNLIQVFKVDKETGLLHEDLSKRITDIERPVCLKFIHNSSPTP
ncbi:MAG: lactonase family protein [Bacteroidales bacterium]|nr:lactonase family protein [Bacteroidales bacterium]